MRPRRESRLGQSIFGNFRGGSPKGTGSAYRQDYNTPFVSNDNVRRHPNRHNRAHDSSGGEDEAEEEAADDRTPLMSASTRTKAPSGHGSSYGIFGTDSKSNRHDSYQRKPSTGTSSSPRRRRGPSREASFPGLQQDYDVNNPPSMPGSPRLGPDGGYDDVMVGGGDFGTSRSPEGRRETAPARDAVIDIDDRAGTTPMGDSSPPSPRMEPGDLQRRRTLALPVEGDVCFPIEGMSELAEEDFVPQEHPESYSGLSRRRRRRLWPDLSVLEEWSREEKEERSEGNGAKKISEPVLVGGRLRPQKAEWHRTEEDAPYRFTYFNEEFQSTIHSQTISELVQPGQSFRDLFIPDPPELSDESADEGEDLNSNQDNFNDRGPLSPTSMEPKGDTRQSPIMGETKAQSRDTSGDATPARSQPQSSKPKRYGARPTFWLDILSPTETEMRVLSKTFGIHALTAEDIMMQEAREKVELFRNYYFINYRTFEQDMNSEDFLEPVNMYVIVFREGVLSFHFSMAPHPANVRRRIRQLKDYLILSSDWISYAIIDDITDVFQPLIQSIEDEVDDIDDTILQLHSGNKDMAPNNPSASGREAMNEKRSEAGGIENAPSGGDMLRRVGECRKKVMGLYRLLGNKADVIKGFAKRCNEQWEVAPKSEIGLYLGDIQDHILTMTSNLSHYETLLSRAHSNYLAQINIRMNERQEKTADVLGKLTVLGTIVLPMNIICGMWGMNVKVPGQEIDNLYWFWSSIPSPNLQG